MSYRIRIYLHGAFAAAVNSVSNTVLLNLLDEKDFDPMAPGGLKKLSVVVIVSAVVGFFTYVKQHPLPDLMKDTDYYQVKSDKLQAIEVKEEKARAAHTRVG
jgi:hypothetical protein